jgi:hypothetical protein
LIFSDGWPVAIFEAAGTLIAAGTIAVLAACILHVHMFQTSQPILLLSSEAIPVCALNAPPFFFSGCSLNALPFFFSGCGLNALPFFFF